ncbi:MAG TPA: dTDP-4-dehydrorhamnose reductase [Usitatibacteraceae bacterium]|nr:dTDP-4-dehydrorhamnose reductase [Usitatibacteraceae bacterium]
MAGQQPRVLITGGDGQLGFELARALQGRAEVVALNRAQLDLGDAEAIVRSCRDLKPALILNPGAYTAVDKAESEPELAMRINGIAPGVLGEQARRLGVPVVHFSTDYVFDGLASVPYREDDATHPQSAYGKTKLAGEQALAASGAEHLILRTSWLYGNRRHNFFLTMLRLARERDILRVVADQIGAPTWVRPLAEASAAALSFSAAGAALAVPQGLYHLSAAGQTSWHGFAEALLAAVPDPARKCARVEAITTAEFPTPARRPAYSVLANARWIGAGGGALPGWERQLEGCAAEYRAAFP